MTAPLDDYRWLVGDEATPWLRKVDEDLPAMPPAPAYLRQLRLSVGAVRTSLVLEQVELRRKAQEKFSQAHELFFTRQGLEQATDELLAAYKAQKFADTNNVVDLCCGIGGDAMALAEDLALSLVDRNEISLLFAGVNVSRVRQGIFPECIAESVDARHVAECDAWHIDPDRRSSGKRTSRVELGDPGNEVIDRLRAANPHAAIKLAPAAGVPDSWLAECEREWIETRGECRQQLVWLGKLAEAPHSHVATLVDANGESCSFAGKPNVAIESSDKVGAFLFDPAPSLVAARLVGALAEAWELSGLSLQSLYLTGDSEVQHPLLQAFVVEAEMPLDVRKLRAYFQARNVGRLEIKKRNIDITPESLRPQLALAGENEGTLLLTRVGSKVRAIVGRRL